MSQAVLAHRLLKPDYTTSPLLQKERTFSVSAEIFSCAQVTQFFLVNPTDFKQSPCWQITPLKIFSRQGQEIFLRKILRSSAPLTVKNFGGINQPRGLLKKNATPFLILLMRIYTFLPHPQKCVCASLTLERFSDCRLSSGV